MSILRLRRPRSSVYLEQLSADRLVRFYRLAPARVRRHLQAELAYILGRLRPVDRVVHLGCGYGRILPLLERRVELVIGLDISRASLVWARLSWNGPPGPRLLRMDAAELGLASGSMDRVICNQNCICAFQVEPRRLMEESHRVLRPGGIALFSAYSPSFWPHQMEWCRRLVEDGLLEPIDESSSQIGRLICRDGFCTETVTAEQLRAYCLELGFPHRLVEVDDSCVFCEIRREDA